MKRNENFSFDHEKHYQAGYVVKIKAKPAKSKKRGFTVGSEHIIQKPPKKFLNSGMSVWLKTKQGTKVSIGFQYFMATGKKAK